VVIDTGALIPVALNIQIKFMFFSENRDYIIRKAIDIGDALISNNLYSSMDLIIQGTTPAKFRISNIPLVIKLICVPLHKNIATSVKNF